LYSERPAPIPQEVWCLPKGPTLIPRAACMIVREKRRERRSDGRRAHDDLRDASNLCGLVISELAESGEPTSGLEPLSCSLRVRWELLTSVHHCTEIAIGMRIYVTTAHHCSPLSRSGCRQTVVSPIEVVNAPIHNLYVTYRTHSTNEQFWQCTGTD
jgi:hypothetical protein